jgi:hypothetical protein
MKELFKARCSSLGTLMQVSGLTDKQLETLSGLLLKPKLTELQSISVREMEFKRDNPELLQGAKTMLNDWFAYSVGHDKDYPFLKEAQKGVMMEDAAIEITDNVIFGGVGLVKNKEKKENDFIQGTCDVSYEDYVIDQKAPWNSKTFFSKAMDSVENNYLWQLKGYSILFNKPRAILSYTLVNTPTWACLNASYNNRKLDDIEFESTYDDIPEAERVIAYEIPILEKDEKDIEMAVLRCRDYLAFYESLIKSRLGVVIEYH